MFGVGIGLGDILALHIDALEAPRHGLVEHVGNAHAGLVIQRHAPEGFEQLARGLVRHMAIAGELVRKGAHVAGALHIILPAQRIHANALAAKIARRHRQIGHAHDHGGALAVFGDAKPVIDGAIAPGCEEPRGGAHIGGFHAGDRFNRFGRIFRARDEARPCLEISEIAALAHKGFIDEALGHDDMGEGVDHGHVGAGQQRQMIGGLHMGRLDEIDAARVHHDELRTLPQAPLHARGEDGMGVRGIGADDEDHIGLLDRFEILRASRCAEGGLQSIARGRVAHAGAGVDVVVAKARAHQLLHDEDFFVRAARGGDGAHGVAAMGGLNALELGSRMGEGLIP